MYKVCVNSELYIYIYIIYVHSPSRQNRTMITDPNSVSLFRVSGATCLMNTPESATIIFIIMISFKLKV